MTILGPERARPDADTHDRTTPARPEADTPRLTPAAQLALELIEDTVEDRLSLTGDEGLLTELVATVLQRGLEVELAAHLGHERWDAGARGADNIRNGAYPKRVLTDLGFVQLHMPRDRRGTFEPVIVPKHGRRLSGSAAPVAALYASGLTRAELRTQLDTITGARLERETLESLTADLEPEIRAWQRRRLAPAHPVLLLDTIGLISRGRRATRRLLDVAVSLDADGEPDLLGLWRRPGRNNSEPAWAAMLEDLQHRGVSSVEYICTDRTEHGLEVLTAAFPGARHRADVTALMDNSLR